MIAAVAAAIVLFTVSTAGPASPSGGTMPDVFGTTTLSVLHGPPGAQSSVVMPEVIGTAVGGPAGGWNVKTT